MKLIALLVVSLLNVREEISRYVQSCWPVNNGSSTDAAGTIVTGIFLFNFEDTKKNLRELNRRLHTVSAVSFEGEDLRLVPFISRSVRKIHQSRWYRPQRVFNGKPEPLCPAKLSVRREPLDLQTHHTTLGGSWQDNYSTGRISGECELTLILDRHKGLPKTEPPHG